MGSSSILTSIKEMLGLDEETTVYDTDLIMHINAVLLVLQQLGVGPKTGYIITGPFETWDMFLPDSLPNLQMVQSYVYLRVKLMFDPPTTSFVLDSMKRMADEFEWRINMQTEGGEWNE